jgi:hypothetical protein
MEKGLYFGFGNFQSHKEMRRRTIADLNGKVIGGKIVEFACDSKHVRGAQARDHDPDREVQKSEFVYLRGFGVRGELRA